MAAYVSVSLELGDAEWLRHGDQIGRSEMAAIRLDDLRIPEAHAQISHRQEGLTLLKLRGSIQLLGQPVDEVVLEEGQVFTLADGSRLSVLEIREGESAQPRESTIYADIEPLRIVANFSTATMSGGGMSKPLLLTGIKAALVCGLVQFGEPVRWYSVARRIWAKPADQSRADHKASVRMRWDQAVYRTRQALDRAGLNRDLLVSNGGMIGLGLLPSDQIEDHTDDDA